MKKAYIKPHSAQAAHVTSTSEHAARAKAAQAAQAREHAALYADCTTDAQRKAIAQAQEEQAAQRIKLWKEHAATLTQAAQVRETPDTVRHIAAYEDNEGNRRELVIDHAQAGTYKAARAIAQAGAQAGEKLSALYVDDTVEDDGVSLMQAARACVRISLKNSCSREGSAEQWARYLAACVTEIKHHDVLDMVQAACVALTDARRAGMDTHDANRYTFRALYNYQYSMRAVKLSVHDMRTVYLDDDTDVTRAIAQIAKYGARAGEIDEADIDAQRKADMCRAIMRALTPTQARIAKYLANGLSLRVIAAKMGRDHTTIRDHVKLIRKKAVRLYPDDAMVFDDECGGQVSVYRAREALYEARRAVMYAQDDEQAQAAQAAYKAAQAACDWTDEQAVDMWLEGREQAANKRAQRKAAQAAQAVKAATGEQAAHGYVVRMGDSLVSIAYAGRTQAAQREQAARKTAQGAQARHDRMTARLEKREQAAQDAQARAYAAMMNPTIIHYVSGNK